jgi:inosine-uridine nucleoside N-ribohydrolase
MDDSVVINSLSLTGPRPVKVRIRLLHPNTPSGHCQAFDRVLSWALKPRKEVAVRDLLTAGALNSRLRSFKLFAGLIGVVVMNTLFSWLRSSVPAWLRPGTLLLAAGFLLSAQNVPAAAKPAPAILDTDIGDDIDDTWALGLLLKSPELDLKLVVGDQGKAVYRARLLAKFLQTAGRTDIAVGLGLETNAQGEGPQAEWVKQYDLKSYPGKIHTNGVQAMIDCIMTSAEPVTLIAIGPVPNLAAALEREPKIAQRLRFVGMHGSVRLGYGGSPTVAAEYNVKADVKACQKVFTASWPMLITPLDTCGLITLDGNRYRRLRQSSDPISSAIIENYRLWNLANEKEPAKRSWEKQSSTLFDTVAVYLAISQDCVKIERLGIRVNDQGFTVIDAQAKPMDVAVAWKNLDQFRDFLTDRLTGTAR